MDGWARKRKRFPNKPLNLAELVTQLLPLSLSTGVRKLSLADRAIATLTRMPVRTVASTQLKTKVRGLKVPGKTGRKRKVAEVHAEAARPSGGEGPCKRCPASWLPAPPF